MKYLVFACVLLMSFISGCDTPDTSNTIITASKSNADISQQERWQLMIGKWYGKQPTKDGGIKHELMNRAPDGTYIIQFLIEDKNGSKKKQVEVGHWGVSGSIFFSIFRGWIRDNGQLSPSNPSDAYNYDAYQIIELNEEKFHYKHVSTGNEYTVLKVAPDFELVE